MRKRTQEEIDKMLKKGTRSADRGYLFWAVVPSLLFLGILYLLYRVYLYIYPSVHWWFS